MQDHIPPICLPAYEGQALPRLCIRRTARMALGCICLLLVGFITPCAAYAQDSTPDIQQEQLPSVPTPTPTLPSNEPPPPQPQNGLKPLTDQLRDFFSNDDNDETGNTDTGRPESMENDTDPDTGRGCVPNQEQLDRMMEHYLS